MLEGKKTAFLSCHCDQIQFMMSENRMNWGDEDQQQFLKFIILH